MQHPMFEMPTPGITLFVHLTAEDVNQEQLRAAYQHTWPGWETSVEAGFSKKKVPQLVTLENPHKVLEPAQERLISATAAKFLQWAHAEFPPLQDAALEGQHAAFMMEPCDDLQAGTVAIVRKYSDHTSVLCFDRILLDADRLTVDHLEVVDPMPEMMLGLSVNGNTIAMFEAPSGSEIGRLILQIGEFTGFAVGGVGGMVAAGVCDILPTVLSWFFTPKREPQPSVADLVHINANGDRIAEIGNAVVAKATMFQRYYDSAWDERIRGTGSLSIWRAEAYAFFFENAGIDHEYGLYLKLMSLKTVLSDIEARVNSINRMEAAEQGLFAQCVTVHRLGARILYAILMAVHHVDNVDATVRARDEKLDKPEEIVAQMTTWLRLLDETVLPQCKAFEEKVASIEAAVLKRRVEKLRFAALDRVTEDKLNPEIPYDHHPYAAIVDDGDPDLGQSRREWAYPDGLYMDKKRKKVLPTPQMQRDFAAHIEEVKNNTIGRLYGNGMTAADNGKIREQQERLVRMVKNRIKLITEEEKDKSLSAFVNTRNGASNGNSVSETKVRILPVPA